MNNSVIIRIRNLIFLKVQQRMRFIQVRQSILRAVSGERVVTSLRTILDCVFHYVTDFW